MANELQGMAGAIPRHPLNETLSMASLIFAFYYANKFRFIQTALLFVSQNINITRTIFSKLYRHQFRLTFNLYY